MKENGRMTRLMVSENIIMLMVRHMKVIGSRINSMVRELKHGLMEANMRENINKVKKRGKVNINGQMAVVMKVNGLIIK